MPELSAYKRRGLTLPVSRSLFSVPCALYSRGKMSFGIRQFVLPDLKSQCPFKGSVNPYYLDASADSRAWINSFNVFTDRKQAFFIQGCNELLVSHTYPYAGYEQFRTACDFVRTLLFDHYRGLILCPG